MRKSGLPSFRKRGNGAYWIHLLIQCHAIPSSSAPPLACLSVYPERTRCPPTFFDYNARETLFVELRWRHSLFFPSYQRGPHFLCRLVAVHFFQPEVFLLLLPSMMILFHCPMSLPSRCFYPWGLTSDAHLAPPLPYGTGSGRLKSFFSRPDRYLSFPGPSLRYQVLNFSMTWNISSTAPAVTESTDPQNHSCCLLEEAPFHQTGCGSGLLPPPPKGLLPAHIFKSIPLIRLSVTVRS